MPRDLTDLLWSLAWTHFKPTKIEGADGDQQWTTETDPLCTFTGGETERIEALLKTKSFAARINPKKITFADLQGVNVEKLSVVWPPSPSSKSGLPYDGNSVDQAYFNHLAFGFGNNCAAIEQYALGGDCPLQRDKWVNRPDYLRGTILKACAIPKHWKRRNSPVEPGAVRAAPPPPVAAPWAPSVETSQQIAAAFGESLIIPTPPEVMPVAVVPALPAMVMNQKDKYEANLDYVCRTLETDGLLSFDEFRGQPMYGTVEAGLIPMEDEDYINLRKQFEREKNFAPVGKELMRDAVHVEARKRRYDSLIQWLSEQVWDGVPRVERFMHTHFGAEDSEYTRAVGRYMWTGLAGRAFVPGCQLDMVIAMQSTQGTKKSTGLKALVPDPDWFTDGLSLNEDDDNFKRLIRGKVVVEIAELAGLSKSDVNYVKRVITRTTEKWIEKYQSTETRFERRCMLFASTNDKEFLPPDETGQRRWLPLVIAAINKALVERDRAQLWAEGAAMWRESGIAFADAERLATGKHKDHELGDVWEVRIAEWLEAAPAAGGEAPYMTSFTVADVLEGAIRMQPSHMDQKSEKRAGRVLRQLGYVSKAVGVGGKVVRRWVLNIPPPPTA